jgi:hypothetical protein
VGLNKDGLNSLTLRTSFKPGRPRLWADMLPSLKRLDPLPLLSLVGLANGLEGGINGGGDDCTCSITATDACRLTLGLRDIVVGPFPGNLESVAGVCVSGIAFAERARCMEGGTGNDPAEGKRREARLAAEASREYVV